MIIAVDFDGILCKNAFPEIGEPNYEIVSLVRQLIDKGHKVILWTSRVDDKLVDAVKWCHSYGLHFCGVNENEPDNLAEFGTDPRKIFADVYIDDHNIDFIINKNANYNAIWDVTQMIKRILKMEVDTNE